MMSLRIVEQGSLWRSRRKVGITLRVMGFPHAEREVYYAVDAVPPWHKHVLTADTVADLR
jgi:hypothetical protein